MLNLKGCAVRDDGSKPAANRRGLLSNFVVTSKYSTTNIEGDRDGSSWHVFSIYYETKRSNYVGVNNLTSKEGDHDEEVPLLRFSTQNLAEKLQWIELISEACCNASEGQINDGNGPVVSPKKVSISVSTSENDMSGEVINASPRTMNKLRQLGSADFETLAELKTLEHNKGTLPPVYFSKAIARRKSRTKKTRHGSAKSNPRTTSGYPPSRPMHQTSEPSYLSSEAPNQNYRGFLNLAFIILLISNFRLILDNFLKNGFVLWEFIWKVNVYEFTKAPMNFPLMTGQVIMIVNVFITYITELGLGYGALSEMTGTSIHVLNINFALILCYSIVWFYIFSPICGVLLMMQSTVSWMKLVSYAHANSDYRNADHDVHLATLSLIQNVGEIEKSTTYPSNVNLRDIFFFWFAPTLTYQIAFPRSKRIRWWKVMGLFIRICLFSAFLIFLLTQTIIPYMEEFVADNDFSSQTMASTLLKLAIPNTYVWLLIFYLYFHLFMNLLAEILRFGDRVFYKDWWNCSEVSSYWRLWNMPVHYWLVRHVYFPAIRMGMSNNIAMVVVFAISGVFHEVIISIPFHLIGYWSFIGMMSQIPLVYVTKFLEKKYPGSSLGNVFFWLSFCIVGQPMAILLYCLDYLKAASVVQSMSSSSSCNGLECEL